MSRNMLGLRNAIREKEIHKLFFEKKNFFFLFFCFFHKRKINFGSQEMKQCEANEIIPRRLFDIQSHTKKKSVIKEETECFSSPSSPQIRKCQLLTKIFIFFTCDCFSTPDNGKSEKFEQSHATSYLFDIKKIIKTDNSPPN